jgi:hypothetical protein
MKTNRLRRKPKMKANKLMAALVVFLMVFSTVAVLNQFQVLPTVKAQPGVSEYGNATTEIVYGQSYSSGTIKINTSQFVPTTGGSPYGTNTYRLFYPVYQNYSNNAFAMSWQTFYVGGGPVEVDQIKNSTTLDTSGAAITFNRSGLWILDNNAVHTSDDPTSYAGYIWVNTSTDYSINGVSDIYYGQTGSLTISVDTKGDVGCMVAIVDPSNQTIYNSWRSTGQTLPLDYIDYFTTVGTYVIKAYRDLDTSVSYRYQDQNGENYSAAYGSIGAPDFPANYSYSAVGPWNPPEKNATQVKMKVKTAAKAPYLNIKLSNTSFYWGYPIHIDVNVTNSTGAGLTGTVTCKKGHLYVTDADGAFDISAGVGVGNYTITMPWRGDNPTPWNNLQTVCSAAHVSVNGSWDVSFIETDHFNGTAGFGISNAKPPVQLLINSPSSKKIDVPLYADGDGKAATTTIDFSIYGKTSEWPYYGFDAVKDDAKNITISGDILYPVDAEPGLGNGEWTATVTPTKPNGKITVSIDWPDNGTATQTIDIINGTAVTTSASKFTVGADFNVTVTVKDVDGDALKFAHVFLMWEDSGSQFNDTVGDNGVGNGKLGEYTFWVTADDQPTTAPQNITIAAVSSGLTGYATVLLDRSHDMTVNVTPTSSYAGNSTTYNITVGRTGGGHPETGGLNIALYNETGVLVDNDDAWSSAGEYKLTDEEIILSGGVFHLFAYNDTHDSQGNNATITVTKYQVTSSPSALAWRIDNNTNITFQVTPAFSGTLTLRNVTSTPSGADENETNPLAIDVVDGVGTVTGFNADTVGNITYSFEPTDGADRMADGLTHVTTATATPSPANIYIGESTSVVITVTHPATNQPISGVWVSLDRYNDTNLSNSVLARIPAGKKTDSAGQATFAITAEVNGNVTIYIENASDANNPFYIVAGGRLPMAISLASPSVDEGKTFTADIKSGSTLLSGVTVTVSFAGTTTTTTSGSVTLTAPSVSTNIPYTIAATAVGYSDASAQVTVLNVPKLIVAVTTSNIKAGQDFQIVVADDTGNPVIGATVTLQGATVKTGAGGVATLKAPTTAGNYTITATFGNYEPFSQMVSVGAGGGVPGFELVTLLVAVGIAFLLIRRRRN